MFRTLIAVSACITYASLSGAEIDTTIHALKSNDYEQRQQARSELMQQFASASATDSATLQQLEQATIEHLGADLPLDQQLYLIRLLEAYGNDASTEALAPLLNHTNLAIRNRTRIALAHIGSKRASDYLLDAYKQAPVTEHEYYFEAFAVLDNTPATLPLIDALKSNDPKLAQKATVSLGKLQHSDALPALIKALAHANTTQRIRLEAAMLDIGTDRVTAHSIATTSQSAANRNGAFSQLIALSPEKAIELLKAILSDTNYLGRALILRTAMMQGSANMQQTLVDYAKDAPFDDQMIIVTAIGELELRHYEPELLAIYANADNAIKPTLIEALGSIGGESSFQILYQAFEANPTDSVLAVALARLQAPSVDQKALNTLANSTSTQARINAIKLLQLRNTDGATALLNRIAYQSDIPELRKAVFKGLENIGDLESVATLIQLINKQDALQRPAQQSLKRLSISFAAPDFLWDELYQPAIQSADDDTQRIAFILILDGIAGSKSLDYLVDLARNTSTAPKLKDAALRTLTRWPNVDTGDFWLSVILDSNASPKEKSNAEKAIKRLHFNKDIQGDKQDKLEFSLRVIQQTADPALKDMVITSYEDGLHWREKMLIKGIFNPLKTDPELGPRVTEILNF